MTAVLFVCFETSDSIFHIDDMSSLLTINRLADHWFADETERQQQRYQTNSWHLHCFLLSNRNIIHRAPEILTALNRRIR